MENAGLKSCAVGRRRRVTAFAGTEPTVNEILFRLHAGGDWALRPTAQDFSPTSFIIIDKSFDCFDMGSHIIALFVASTGIRVANRTMS